jgi:hypothetical protein
MTARTEVTVQRQDSQVLPLEWRALESGIGSGSITPEANGACPVYAFPGAERRLTLRGRPS